MRVSAKLVFIIIICLFIIRIQGTAATIGSDTSVARFDTKQSLDNGDRIAGFAAIENGFELNGAFVTGTFDSLFPIAGCMDLNGGTLVLDKNLRLDHVSEWAMLGNITGNNRLIDLGGSVASVSSLSDEVFYSRLYSIAEVATGESIEAVDWSWDDQYLAVATEVSLTSSALSIYQFDGSSLSLLLTHSVDATEVQANEVRWHPSKYILGLVRDNSAGGDEVFTYSFIPNPPQLIQLSSDEIGDTVNAVAWHPTGDYMAVAGLSNDAEIVVYPVDEDGVLDTGSKLVKDLPGGSRNIRQESLGWDKTGNYLAAGFNSDPELVVYEFGTLPLSLTENATKSVGALADGVDWNPTYSWILSMGVTGIDEDIIVYAHDNITGTITQLVSDSVGGASKSHAWHPDGNCLAVGRNKIGEIAKFNTYTFDKDVPSLTLATDIDFGDSVEAVRWSPNGTYLAKGSGINLAVYGLIKDHCSVFNNVHLLIRSNMTLKNCCIYFQGNCSIDGGGHELNLEQSSLMKITNNSQLYLKNITLKGLKYATFRMGASGSHLVLENVKAQLGTRLIFDKGYFDVLGSVVLTGYDGHFIYSSNQVSTIGHKSELILDGNITFSYDASAPNLLQFEDGTGRIVLAGATLHATSTGLELTKGKMDVIDTSYLASEVITTEDTTIDNGITFGSGAVEDNFKVKICPNVSLDCVSGRVKYKNTWPRYVLMVNNLSKMHFYTDTILQLYENMNITPGFIEFEDQSALLRASGKNLTGSIVPNGTLIRGTFIP